VCAAFVDLYLLVQLPDTVPAAFSHGARADSVQLTSCTCVCPSRGVDMHYRFDDAFPFMMSILLKTITYHPVLDRSLMPQLNVVSPSIPDS